MNKRSTPIMIISCILALMGAAGYLMPPPTEANPTRVLMQNAGGRVVFAHQAHSTPGGPYGDSSCAACHHELNIGGPAVPEAKGGTSATGIGDVASAIVVGDRPLPKVAPCKSCHGAVDNPDYIAGHQKLYQARGGGAACAACHHTRMAGFAGGWNHQEHWNYAGDDCATCHHPLNYEVRPGRVMAIKPQKCRNCHTAKPNPMTATALKDAAHSRCQSCHSEWLESGTKACRKCHSLVPSKDDPASGASDLRFTACVSCHSPMLNPMDAYHAKCRTCHDKAGKGPGAKAPCAQCHTP